MSNINPLLQAAVNTEELKTEMLPVPEGVHRGQVFDYEIKTFEAKEPGKPDSNQLVVTFNLTDPALAKEMDRDVVRTKAQIWLNVDEDGSLSSNNIGLGRLLEACEAKDLGTVGLGEALESIKGIECALVVKHRLWEENVYDEVKAVKSLDFLEE